MGVRLPDWLALDPQIILSASASLFRPAIRDHLLFCKWFYGQSGHNGRGECVEYPPSPLFGGKVAAGDRARCACCPYLVCAPERTVRVETQGPTAGSTCQLTNRLRAACVDSAAAFRMRGWRTLMAGTGGRRNPRPGADSNRRLVAVTNGPCEGQDENARVELATFRLTV